MFDTKRSPIVKEAFTVLNENITNPLVWSFLFNPAGLLVTHRIRCYVLPRNAEEAWRLKESYKDIFSMGAVAAAIVAQVAISLLGLADFGNIHWTATAFAYTSLASGLLSTFFSSYVQQFISELDNDEAVLEWLTSPSKNSFDRSNTTRNRNEADEPASEFDRIPSLTAAATLSAPGRLLIFSIFTLFVALGIYLGSVYTAKLGALKGRNANLAVLLFFILSVLVSSEAFLPRNIRMLNQIMQMRSGDQRAPTVSSDTAEIDRAIQQALQASICAQEESLKAQKVLLQLIRGGVRSGRDVN